MAAARGGPEGLDAAATRAIRLAVEIGATLRDDLYVTFTTLLLALIYAEEDVSRRFRSTLETTSPGSSRVSCRARASWTLWRGCPNWPARSRP